MAVIGFEISDGKKTRVIDALALQWGYQDQVEDPNAPGTSVPNPQTKEQFVSGHLKQTVLGWIANKQSVAAGKLAKDNQFRKSMAELG